MIDLHLHVLPGLDDGPADLDAALALVAALVEAGVTTAVATPHLRPDLEWDNGRDRVVAAVGQLRSAIAQRGLALELVPGAEHFLDDRLAGFIESGTATPINLDRYLLVELSSAALPPDLPGALYRLRRLGVEPLLAHVERYAALCDDRTLRATLVDQGYLLQVDCGALTGEFGRDQKRAAWDLVENVSQLLVASDAHSADDVRATVQCAARMLQKKLGADRARQLLVDHPAAVLAGRALDAAP